jgi:hemoglobin/transferrin/lactoferrin receptor protein
VELTYFTTDYDNFIDDLVFIGIDPSNGLTTFQSVNRAEVTIDGWEARGQLLLGEFASALNGFSLNGALAYADGDDKEANVPINEIEPLTSVVGLRWSPENRPVDLELIWTWVDDKDDDDVDPSAERPATRSYHLLDLLARYEFAQRFTLDVGLFNLTNETYIRWADTAGIGDDAINRFTQPGRNLSATVRVSL